MQLSIKKTRERKKINREYRLCGRVFERDGGRRVFLLKKTRIKLVFHFIKMLISCLSSIELNQLIDVYYWRSLYYLAK